MGEDQILTHYYHPTNFLLNVTGRHRWDFNVNGDKDGWVIRQVEGSEQGHESGVRDGVYSIKPAHSSVQIESYPLMLETESFDSVFVKMRSELKAGLGKVYFTTDQEPFYSEEKAVGFEINHDGELHEYKVYMADHSRWSGAVSGIRFHFFEIVADKSTEIALDRVRLGRGYLSRIPDTGQTKCYNSSQEIPCPSPGQPFCGQDAHYVINPTSYEVKIIDGDEVVMDHVTELMWSKGDDDFKGTRWEGAEHSTNLKFGWHADWRLPTKRELLSILDYSKSDPALDPQYFAHSREPEDRYWAVKTPAVEGFEAWGVSLWDGEIRPADKGDKYYVRAVRGRPLEFGDFRDNGDGTVTDITTGLMWQQGEARSMVWEASLAYCEQLELAGYDDWRLPNVRELSSLIDDERKKPSIDTSHFPGCRPSPYWSSTTHAKHPDFAWSVGFDDAATIRGGHKRRRHFVRAVRGGL
jgi:hypothetical protein